MRKFRRNQAKAKARELAQTEFGSKSRALQEIWPEYRRGPYQDPTVRVKRSDAALKREADGRNIYSPWFFNRLGTKKSISKANWPWPLKRSQGKNSPAKANA